MADCNGKCESCSQSSIPSSAVMNVTDACNFRCPYCFVHHNPRRMTLETAERVCEYLLKSNSNLPSLSFFGGEPTLEYETIIKPIVEKYHGRIQFNITTNGSLLTEDMIDFFYKYGITVLLSIDGCEKVQNYNRPYADGSPTFNDVVKNIPYLLLKFPETLFRATLTKFSIPYMYESFKFAEHMGFKQMTFVINENEEYDDNDYEQMIYQYDKIVVDILNGAKCWLTDITKIAEFINRGEESIHRCGFGTTSMGITVNGEITPCQELSSFDGCVIGDIENGISKKKHDEFLMMAAQETKLPEGLSLLEQKAVRHGYCPKHQYFDNNFTLTIGRLCQLRALTNIYVKLKKLTRWSSNPAYRRMEL